MGNAIYKLNHRKQGLCENCSNPAALPRKLCVECLQKHNESTKRSYKKHRFKRILASRALLLKRKEESLCISCGIILGEADEGFTHCLNCRSKSENHHFAGNAYATYREKRPGQFQSISIR